jgi:hypothetical protein
MFHVYYPVLYHAVLQGRVAGQVVCGPHALQDLIYGATQ